MPDNARKILERSISYTIEVMKTRDGKGQVKYEEACRRYLKQIARPQSLEKLEVKSLAFGVYSTDLEEENWYHCQKLLQLITKLTQLPEIEASHHKNSRIMRTNRHYGMLK